MSLQLPGLDGQYQSTTNNNLTRLRQKNSLFNITQQRYIRTSLLHHTKKLNRSFLLEIKNHTPAVGQDRQYYSAATNTGNGTQGHGQSLSEGNLLFICPEKGGIVGIL